MADAKKKVHYVNNKQFLEAIVVRKQHLREAEESGDPKPQITNYLGECILKIANHLSYRPNFINYTYRDEMISDGIENSLQYIDNFDPEKSKNPFAYFTQIIYFAFIRRITKEKKQQMIKEKLLKHSNIEERIALQAELEIGKKTTSDGPHGPDGVMQDTSITIDNIEEVNKKKMELASTEQIQVQKDVDRSKLKAYYRMMMEPYFTGAAQG